ncbi:MAG: DUF1697 domain-containing protein [Acetobacteraceae bacterium]|nr:DUF1697 domain-containing protein [Acetobacteraceae bacterium]
MALLRAINVGGRAPLAMADLRQAAERIGLRAPRTLLQSGNLIFESAANAPPVLQTRLESELAAAFALETSVLVRSAAEWRALVAGLPFPDVARADPSHLIAMPLRVAPDVAQQAALAAAISGRERAAVVGATAYIVYPDGIGRAKLTAARIERHLGTLGTCRNWRTVRKIELMLGC